MADSSENTPAVEAAKKTGIDVGADDGSIIIYQNPEKKNAYRLGKPEFMPMNGSRILFSATPNRGKRNMILNIINRLDPKPEAIHVVHANPFTVEYDTLGSLGVPIYMYAPEDFPTLENIINPELPDNEEDDDENGGAVAVDLSREVKTEQHEEKNEKSHDDEEEKSRNDQPRCSVVIVDECPADTLGKVGTHRFERLVNMICTHHNVLLLCSIQDLLNLPPKCRRSFNHIVLWQATDKNVDKYAASRAGIPADVLDDLFQLCRTKYDSIWIDLDRENEDPLKFRLNFTTPISIELGNNLG